MPPALHGFPSSIRQPGRVPCRLPRRWRWRGGFCCTAPGQLTVRQAPPDDRSECFREAAGIAADVLALVEPEGLLIEIAEEVKRLDADVGAPDRALEARPEVLDSVRVDVISHVLLGGMIDSLVLVHRLAQSIRVHFEGVEVHRGDRTLQRKIAAVLVGMNRRPGLD